LTDQNLWRNIIDQVSGLNHCPRLQRTFLSNNKLAEFSNIACLKDCQQLQELAIDGNLVSNKKGYIEFCLTNCPNLKQLDLKKVTPEMREQSGVTATVDDKKSGVEASRSDSTAIDTDSYLGKISSVGPSSIAASSAINSHVANTA
jgi:hypothetical protein